MFPLLGHGDHRVYQTCRSAVIGPLGGDAIEMSGSMLFARSLQGIDIVVSGLGRGVHGVAIQGMGGNQKGGDRGGEN